ncbi:hypothetical protein MKW94_017456 [Papaver nudicaule]|uniref:Response regulatory domain-containing protein n=1 Tax=Papaver nudicaule TaxID=74823 RepID=A0AA41UY57_PAPNU|nr:hypothetical protein [Papaver nudicaule]
MATMSALVVDDQKIMRKIHCALLQKLGVQTQEAENGLEALKLLESGAKFDIILMDYEMPVMNGAEATQRIRGMGVSSVILGVSSETDEATRENFRNSGLTKLFDKKTLTSSDVIPYLSTSSSK